MENLSYKVTFEACVSIIVCYGLWRQMTEVIQVTENVRGTTLSHLSA